MEDRYCYHHLSGSIHGKLLTKRIDDGNISLSFADRDYELRVDARDKRVLVCFDGAIPWGGLPLGSTVLLCSLLPELSCHISDVYQKRSIYEENSSYELDGMRAVQCQCRFFVLLRSCRAVFRKYKIDTLQPKYLIVDVHDDFAEFSTGS